MNDVMRDSNINEGGFTIPHFDTFDMRDDHGSPLFVIDVFILRFAPKDNHGFGPKWNPCRERLEDTFQLIQHWLDSIEFVIRDIQAPRCD